MGTEAGSGKMRYALVLSWIEVARELGREVPRPTSRLLSA